MAGLRRGDMMGMRWVDLDLNSFPPTLTIRGGKARHRVDVIPPRSEIAAELQALKPASVHPTANVFPTSVTHMTRRKDFERAGIVLETPDGHADLHALRHTLGTRLAEAGAPVAKLRKLMRHGHVQLTLDYYVKLDP
ncbi:MAG: integrase [Chlamydiales bacterium]|jgi:integrase